MLTILLVIHLILALSLVGIVLIQRSEGGGLGIGGGGGSMGGLMSSRGTANLLTRTTAIIAACFMVSSLLLSYLTAQTVKPSSILDDPDELPPIEGPAEAGTVPQASGEMDATGGAAADGTADGTVDQPAAGDETPSVPLDH